MMVYCLIDVQEKYSSPTDQQHPTTHPPHTTSQHLPANKRMKKMKILHRTVHTSKSFQSRKTVRTQFKKHLHPHPPTPHTRNITESQLPTNPPPSSSTLSFPHPNLRHQNNHTQTHIHQKHHTPIHVRPWVEEPYHEMTQPPENHLPTRCSRVRKRPLDCRSGGGGGEGKRGLYVNHGSHGS